MAEYRLSSNPDYVIRNADGATIPDDPGNRDRIEYQDWLALGNTPDPAEPFPPPSSAVKGQ